MSRPMIAGASRRPRLLPPLFGLMSSVALIALTSACAFASELDLQLPTLDGGQRQLLFIGLGVCIVGMLFGLLMFNQVKGMPAHKAMLDVSHIIYETCKAYLLKQGQLLIVLELFIGACIVYYFGVIQHLDVARVLTILGILPDSRYEQGEVVMKPGDLVALYTDGVSEGANPSGEQWGEARLIEALNRADRQPCADIAREIAATVRAFEGEQGATDDITLVIARRRS